MKRWMCAVIVTKYKGLSDAAEGAERSIGEIRMSSCNKCPTPADRDRCVVPSGHHSVVGSCGSADWVTDGPGRVCEFRVTGISNSVIQINLLDITSLSEQHRGEGKVKGIFAPAAACLQ